MKTLQDRPVLIPARTVTLRYLVARPAPAYLPSTRRPFERHIFRVIAAVTMIRPEADDDLHLVLQAGGQTMIAETWAPYCTAGALPASRTQMGTARRGTTLRPRHRNRVAFFDFDHDQIGVAPNAIELHPILAFRWPQALVPDSLAA